MADLLTMIANVDDMEIEQVVNATIKRYRELFPDWEIRIVSLEKAKDRITQLDSEIAFLQRLKEFPIEENP